MAEDIPSNQGASEEAAEEEQHSAMGAMGAPWHYGRGRQQRQSRVERRRRLESKGELLLPSLWTSDYPIFNLALLYLSELLELSTTTSCQRFGTCSHKFCTLDANHLIPTTQELKQPPSEFRAAVS